MVDNFLLSPVFYISHYYYVIGIRREIRDYCNCHHCHYTEITTAFHINQILSPHFVLFFTLIALTTFLGLKIFHFNTQAKL